jgi:hypothetical protein
MKTQPLRLQATSCHFSVVGTMTADHTDLTKIIMVPKESH